MCELTAQFGKYKEEHLEKVCNGFCEKKGTNKCTGGEDYNFDLFEIKGIHSTLPALKTCINEAVNNYSFETNGNITDIGKRFRKTFVSFQSLSRWNSLFLDYEIKYNTCLRQGFAEPFKQWVLENKQLLNGFDPITVFEVERLLTDGHGDQTEVEFETLLKYIKLDQTETIFPSQTGWEPSQVPEYECDQALRKKRIYLYVYKKDTDIHLKQALYLCEGEIRFQELNNLIRFQDYQVPKLKNIFEHSSSRTIYTTKFYDNNLASILKGETPDFWSGEIVFSSMDIVINFLEKIFLTILAMHECDFIHGDISTNNIYFNPVQRNESYYFVLGDLEGPQAESQKSKAKDIQDFIDVFYKMIRYFDSNQRQRLVSPSFMFVKKKMGNDWLHFFDVQGSNYQNMATSIFNKITLLKSVLPDKVMCEFSNMDLLEFSDTNTSQELRVILPSKAELAHLFIQSETFLSWEDVSSLTTEKFIPFKVFINLLQEYFKGKRTYMAVLK